MWVKMVIYLYIIYIYICFARGRFSGEVIIYLVLPSVVNRRPPRELVADGLQNIYNKKVPCAGMLLLAPQRALAGGMAWAPAEGGVCI